MIKISGILVILVSSAMLGVYLGGKEKRRSFALNEIKAALMIMRSEIEFSLSSLRDAALTAAEKTESGTSGLFGMFGDKLAERSGRGADEIWSECLRNSVNFLCIKTEDIERLVFLGASFSAMDKQRTVDGINMAIEYINEKNGFLNEEAAKSVKLYPPLCIFSGLMLVVFLL